MWKQWMLDYCNFSRKSRIGIYVLLGIIVFFSVAPFFFPLFIKQKTTDSAVFQGQITALKLKKEENNYSAPYAEKKYNKYAANDNADNKETNPVALFEFDPNTLDENGWQRLGIRPKTIATITKYLSKGGHFKQAEDIRKIWGIRKEDAERLIPYIRISNTNNNPVTVTSTAGITTYKKYEPAQVDINLADTTAFISLPGIGNKLAKRIVSFREKLGGFYNISQVAETFGLPDSVFQKIKNRLLLSNNSIKQININKAGLDELKEHPYIRYQVANAIIQYRNQHGRFAAVNDLRNIMVINDEIFRKLSPYLSVN